MKQKICPVCDGKLKGNYCPFCHKIVKNPVEWDVAYYLNERHPEWETGCDYHSEPADVYLNQNSGTESLDLQEKKAKKSSKKAAKSSKSKKNTGSDRKNTDSPRKKRRPLWKIILIVVGIWLAADIILILVSYAVSELAWNPILERETRQAVESAEEIQWDTEDSEENWETAEDEWSIDDISELSDAEVIEMGEPCNTQCHFPVTQEAFLEKLTGYLDEKKLLIYDTIQSGTNFIYPAYTEGEYLTSYDQYYTCFLQKEEAEEMNYKTAIYMNYDTVSGELHWLEIDMEEREDAFEAARWAAETLGEMAEYPHPEETAQQIYEELQAEELEKEWRFFDIEEYGLSVSEDQGRTMVILNCSDFGSAN